MPPGRGNWTRKKNSQTQFLESEFYWRADEFIHPNFAIFRDFPELEVLRTYSFLLTWISSLEKPSCNVCFSIWEASSIAVCYYYQRKIVLTSTHCTASAVVASSFPQFSFIRLQMHLPSSNSCNCITIHRHDMEGLWSVSYCCWCFLVDCMKWLGTQTEYWWSLSGGSWVSTHVGALSQALLLRMLHDISTQVLVSLCPWTHPSSQQWPSPF